MAKMFPARTVGLTATGRRIVAASSPSVGASVRRIFSRTRPAPPNRTRPAPPPQPTYPIHLFAEADVASGGEATLRSQALANRTGKPLEIREIRFGALALAAAAAGLARMDAGGLLKFSLNVDDKPITHGYVPMWCLGVTEDYDANNSFYVAGTNFGSWASYVWRLSKPWYLRPGAVVNAQIQHAGASKFAVTGQIGLAGRTAPKSASTSSIPYACAWTSAPVKDSDTAREESIETDLLNVTKRTVMVDRIIARVSTRYSTVVGATTYLTLLDRPFSMSEFGGMELQVFTSDHRPVTPDFLGVSETFGPRRSLEVAHPFDAGDFYRASLRKTAVFSSGANDFYSQAFVSVLGWREEPI